MTRIDYADFLPLFPLETEDAIRARINAWANEGLAPGDPRIRDTREGSAFQIMTEGAVRLAALAYDRMSELLAMSNPIFAGGYYLDLIAISRGIPRTDATFAGGTVTFTGAFGTLITAGTRVSATAASPDDDAISFVTDTSVTIPVGGTVDVPVTAETPGTAGNVSAGSVIFMDTPVTGVTVTNAAPMAGGADIESDDSLAEKIQASFRTMGGANIATLKLWALSKSSIGKVTVRPNFYGPGTVLLIVTAADGSPVSAGDVLDLQNEIDPPTLSTTLSGSVTLPAASIPVVSTTGARGATSVTPDYIQVGSQFVNYTGQDATHFTGATGGTGTFAAGTPVVQSGSGAGLAPIGMYVQVQTSSQLAVDISLNVHPSQGYGVSTLGLTDVTAFIHDALSDYVASVEPGQYIYLSQVLARAAEARGIADVDWTTMTINGSHADLLISSNPPQKPYLRNLTLVSY